MKQIYENKEQLLLPVKPWFVWSSLVISILLDMLPSLSVIWMPSFSFLTVIFWSLHQNKIINIFTALFCGLLLDVTLGNVLGANALIFCATSFTIQQLGYRLKQYSAFQQGVQLFPIFVLIHCVDVAISILLGGSWAGWWFLITPLLDVMIWWTLDVFLLMPQRQPPTKDKNRPI